MLQQTGAPITESNVANSVGKRRARVLTWTVIIATAAVAADVAVSLGVLHELREASYANRPYLTVYDTFNGLEAEEYHLRVLVKNLGEHPANKIEAYFSAFERDAAGNGSTLFLRRVTTANDLAGDHQITLDHSRKEPATPASYIVVLGLTYSDVFNHEDYAQLFVFRWDGRSDRLSEANVEDRGLAAAYAAKRHRLDGDVGAVRRAT